MLWLLSAHCLKLNTWLLQKDLHTPGAESVTFDLGGQRVDVITSLPGVMDTGDTLLSQAGAESRGLSLHTAVILDVGSMQAEPLYKSA